MKKKLAILVLIQVIAIAFMLITFANPYPEKDIALKLIVCELAAFAFAGIIFTIKWAINTLAD